MVSPGQFYVPRYNYEMKTDFGTPFFKEILLLLRHEANFKVAVIHLGPKFCLNFKVVN